MRMIQTHPANEMKIHFSVSGRIVFFSFLFFYVFIHDAITFSVCLSFLCVLFIIVFTLLFDIGEESSVVLVIRNEEHSANDEEKKK